MRSCVLLLVPYQGIDNLRPETQALLNTYLEERKLLE
jgi:hypothetical protein